MPIRKNKGYEGYLILLLLVGIGGYILGIHSNEASRTIKGYTPKTKRIAKKAFNGFKDFSKLNLEKLKELNDSKKKSMELAPVEPKKNLLMPRSEEAHYEEYIEFRDEIRMCSFNIRIFSNRSRDQDELKNIAHILKYCDITAIQELRDEAVLRRTIKILDDYGYPYEYIVSPPVGKKVKELYAFLYNPRIISLIEPGQLYDDYNDDFIREPYFASFQAGEFDFTLITFHALYGDNERQRRPEIIKLANVYRDIQARSPHENDIIMLGDFNFPPTDKGWSNLLAESTMTYLIRPPTKTTITDTSLYDNFWFERRYLKEYTGQSGVIKFDENMFNNDDRKAKLAVSDHRPIWAKFQIVADDD